MCAWGGEFLYSKTKIQKYKNRAIGKSVAYVHITYVCTCLRTPGASDVVMGVGRLGDRLMVIG